MAEISGLERPADKLAGAREAFRLASTGLTGKELGARLDVKTPVALVLADVGRRLDAIATAALTAPEILLLRSIAQCERARIERLESGSVTSFAVACAAGKSHGWPGSTSAKRLRSGTVWCPQTRTYRPIGLGLIDFTGNGYLSLTSLGWTVLQALEASAS